MKRVLGSGLVLFGLVLSSCFTTGGREETESLSLPLASGLVKTRVVTGLSNATAFAFAPDGRIFVAQRGTNGNGTGGTATAAVRVIKNGALLATPFANITVDNTQFSCCNERGLVGIAIDPNFASNQFVYVYYTVPGSPAHNRVARLTANGDVALSGSEHTILELDSLSHPNHNGGALHFGADGKLYVADGNDATNANSQSISNRNGKILRINPDGSIPSDNPSSFPGISGTTSGATRAIWAVGFRNPFTMAIHPATGRIFVNDVGENSREEIDDLVAGRNYGWPQQEGFSGPDSASFSRPVIDYAHGDQGACAITGGTFYHPAKNTLGAAYLDKYFFADYCGGWIRMLDPASRAVSTLDTGFNGPTDLRVGTDGALYVLARNGGELWKIQGSATTTQDLVVSATTLTEKEGSSATFSVKLAAAPTSNVVVSLARGLGSANIGVAPASLTFTPSNFGTAQLVTVSASQDSVTGNKSAIINVSASGLPSKAVDVKVLDDDAAANAPTAEISLPHNGDTVSGTNAEYFGQGTPNGAQLLAVNAGGPLVGSYAADSHFSGGTVSGGTTTSIDTGGVVNPAPASVYQSGRYGAFSYAMTGLVPNVGHTVRLHFAEYVFGSAGQRVFGASVNGKALLTNFDIYAAAGGKYRAVVRELTATSDAQGTLTVAFTPSVQNPLLQGLQLFRGAATVVKAEFYVDGALKFTDTKNSPPDHYHYSGSHDGWDTTGLSNGAHTLRLAVYDQLGASNSDEVVVNVSN